MSATAWQQWVPITPLTKTFGYVQLPAFSYSGTTWKGASEIVAQYNYSATKNFTIRSLPETPSGVDYCLVIRYRIGSTVYRFKLWEGVGEVLNERIYRNDIIKKNFVLEIWNVQSVTTQTQATAITLPLSIQRVVTDFASIPADYVDATGEEITPLGTTITLDPNDYGTLTHWFKSDEDVVLSGTDVVSWSDLIGDVVLQPLAGTPFRTATGFGGTSKPFITIQAGNNLGYFSGTLGSQRTIALALQVPVYASGVGLFTNGARVLTCSTVANQLRCAYKATNSDCDGYFGVPIAVIMTQTQAPLVTNQISVYRLDGLASAGPVIQTSADPSTPAPTTFEFTGANAFDVAEALTYSTDIVGGVDLDGIINYLRHRYYGGLILPYSFATGSAGDDN